jgi:hypothetical protein
MYKKKYIIVLLIFYQISLKAQNEFGIIKGEIAYSNFGYEIAMSGNGKRIITSSTKSEKCGNNCGDIKIYELRNNKWEQLGKTVIGENPGDYFGSSVDISFDGSRIIVSSPNNDINGYISGLVKVYEFINNQWEQVGQNLSGQSKDMFGSIVKISKTGNQIAISCPFSQNDDFIRIYEYINKKWVIKGQDILDSSQSEYFGASISLDSSGNRIAISCLNPNTFGYVRIFDFKNNRWIQNGKDIKSNKAKDSFGFSVSLSEEGNVLAIGAPEGNNFDSEQNGFVNIYEQKDKDWKQIGNSLYGENRYDLFGQAIKISSNGKLLIASSIFSDINGANSGQFRVFEYYRNSWNQIFKKNGNMERDYFGKSLSSSSKGDIIVVSATQEWYLEQGLGEITTFNIKKHIITNKQ